MVDGVDKQVKTTFTVDDKASAKTKKIGKNMSNVGGQIGRATGMLGPLMMGLGAFGAFVGARTVSKLGDQFEQTNLQLGGFLNALGFSKDFNHGMAIAASTMERIRVAAALLPGEAEDYITVFKAGLPVMAKAVEGSLGNMVKFSNKYAAITKSLGVDSMQAGRDLALMLRGGLGGAGADVRSFMTLAPFIRRLKGQADMTTKSFNKMTSPERAKILQKTFASFGPMLAAASNTYDAQFGAAKSNAQLLVRLGTKPMFVGMKSALGLLNSSLSTADGQLTPLADKIVSITTILSKGVVSAMGMIVGQAKELFGWFDKIGKTVGFATAKDDLGDITAMFGSVAKLGTERTANAGTSGGGGAGALGGIGALLMGVTGPFSLVFAGLASFATRTEAVGDVLGELATLGSVLAPALGIAAESAMVVSSMLGDVLEGALGGFIAGLRMIVDPIVTTVVGLTQLTLVAWTKLRPAFLFLWKAVGELFVSVGQFLGPVMRIFGAVLLNVYRVVARYLVPVLDVAVKAIAYFIKGLASALSFLGASAGAFADNLDIVLGTNTETKRQRPLGDTSWDVLQSYIDKVYSYGKKKDSLLDLDQIGAPKAPKSRGGGGRTVQDFRYSRFTIDQKFAEGMDPDRVAVALAQDIGKISEQRLQSGFEPLFTVG